MHIDQGQRIEEYINNKQTNKPLQKINPPTDGSTGTISCINLLDLYIQ